MSGLRSGKVALPVAGSFEVCGGLPSCVEGQLADCAPVLGPVHG